MNNKTAYKDFTTRLRLLISKHPDLITTTLSNIFTMRLIGNKTHGDLAEIAIAEFINQYMYDFRSIHVGKDLYRAKSQEEDIKIINEITKTEFPVSLKAYGDGPLQLSTDKNFRMFPRLEQESGDILGKKEISISTSPHYFMSYLGYMEKKRGNLKVALAWYKKSWLEAKGSATRIQWGSSYLRKLIDLTENILGDTFNDPMIKYLKESLVASDAFNGRNLKSLNKLAKSVGKSAAC